MSVPIEYKIREVESKMLYILCKLKLAKQYYENSKKNNQEPNENLIKTIKDYQKNYKKLLKQRDKLLSQPRFR